VSYPIPPNTRAVGTGNPPVDMDLVASLLAYIMGTTAGSTVTAPAAIGITTGRSFRLPAGWYWEWAATTATLAEQIAIGC